MSNRYRPVWAPDAIDIETPSAARMYDYFLGGSHNFPADRALGEEVIRAFPDSRELCQANRAFLHRALAALCELGIDQFLDLGSGIPTVSNVHDAVREVNPNARTVYVDGDAVAYAHGQALLADVPEAVFVREDLRDPEAVLSNPDVTRLLDFSRPVAVLLFSVLHFVSDEDEPKAVLATYRDATVPGSYLAITHGTADYKPKEAKDARDVYARSSHPVTSRSRESVLDLFDGYDLLSPGLTDAILWRPDPHSPPDPLGGDVARYSLYGAVGRKV
ncbi:MAG TPA: SAM-dependent methyltransferase [Actinospica sp.]|nr:SAM-dependent methyltransferase [Actinospica sp.]